MRADQVPQDGNATLGGHRKAVYAVGPDGRYTVVPSSGWEAEETVTLQAVEQFRRLEEDARRRALEGSASPLEFHMYRCRMDPALLAQTTGLWRWRIRRHFRPRVFARLKPALLARYAEALGISVDALQRVQ
ncbi:MAG: hypothetical protein WA373_14280 [Burkholderiales bacterium]